MQCKQTQRQGYTHEQKKAVGCLPTKFTTEGGQVALAIWGKFPETAKVSGNKQIKLHENCPTFRSEVEALKENTALFYHREKTRSTILERPESPSRRTKCYVLSANTQIPEWTTSGE